MFLYKSCKNRVGIFRHILFNTLTARSSAFGNKWQYVFQVTSILECPNRLEISWIFISLSASTEAWVCPYGIITLNPIIQQYQWVSGLALFFFTLFQTKYGADFLTNWSWCFINAKKVLPQNKEENHTWKDAPGGKILKRDVVVAKNYLNEQEMSRLNRLVTMFIDYAELMAEDGVALNMKDWLNETDNFLNNNRRKVLQGKGYVSHEDAMKKASDIYEQFRVKQDKDYISEFDKDMAKYLKGKLPEDE